MNTTAIIVIDKILQMMPVRWGLLVLSVVLLAVSGWYYSANKVLSLQLDAAKGQNAELSTSLTVQNDAIQKQGKDMAELQKRSQEASQQVAIMKKKLKERQIEIREVVLTGTCPNMVQQVLDEVRK